MEGLVSHPPPEDGRPAPLQGKPLSGDRYHPSAADCPRPGPERTLRKREAGAWKGLEAKGSGLLAKGRTQAGVLRTAVQATRASTRLALRGAGQALEEL